MADEEPRLGPRLLAELAMMRQTPGTLRVERPNHHPTPRPGHAAQLVTRTNVIDARAALERLDALARRFRLAGSLAAMGCAEAEAADIDRDALHRFVEQMDSDLDTPMALAGIFELVRRANAAAEAGDGASGRRLAAAVAGGAGAGTVRHAAEGPS